MEELPIRPFLGLLGWLPVLIPWAFPGCEVLHCLGSPDSLSIILKPVSSSVK